MDVADIAAAVPALSQARVTNAVQMAVLKKAMDIQAQGAMQLVQAVTKNITSNPPHLGNGIDTIA